MKTFGLPVKLAISVLIIAALVHRMNKDMLAQIGGNIHASAWLLAILMLFMQIVALTIRWYDLLNLRDKTISMGASLRMTVAGQLANTLLITSIGGVVVRIGLATQAGIPLLRAICATVTDRLMTLVALMSLAALAMPAFNHLHSNPMLSVYLPGMVIGLIAAFAVGALMLRKNLLSFLAVNKKFEACLLYLRDMANDLPLMLRILSVSLIAQIFYFMSVFLIANSTDIHIEFSRLLIVLPVITLIASLPLSIGGWGIREGAFVYGLGLLGVPMETSFLISVQIGLITIIATILAGIPALMNPDIRSILQKNKSTS